MVYVTYDQAVDAMTRGLLRYMDEERAKEFAQIIAGNSMDGIYSHGMNRYPRYLRAMESGICDPSVREIEKVAAFGALETWDAKEGIGPLMARQATARAIALAKEHGVACVALRNNSHWLRAGRYALDMAQAGLCGICFTNTCQNLAPWGCMEKAIGNNPIAMAIPRGDAPLLMDMAVSQYAYGKMEIMAKEGKRLDVPCGYNKAGEETCDPKEIVDGGVMTPMAMWKGNALSVMLDLMAAMLSGGRTSLDMGTGSDNERGMSQVFIAMHPAAVGDMEEIERRMQRTLDALHALPVTPGQPGVRAPGENLAATRARHAREGIPVAEDTWESILAAAR